MKHVPNYFFGTIFLISFLLTLAACKRERAELDYTTGNYPQDIGKIIISNCAVPGCHNNISKEAAGGLSLETWNTMMDGARAGAVVIPYRPDFSTLMYYINTYADLGLTLLPTMPVGKPPLSKEDVLLIKNWINNGAPNNTGYVNYSDNFSATKFYVANQGCDVVTIFDAKTMLAKRYVDVGTIPAIEAPHMIKVSPDNKYWYVTFTNGEYFQKYSTSDNMLVGQALLNGGQWKTFTLSSDSKKAYVTNWSSDGEIAIVNLDDMTHTRSGNFILPYGITLNPNDDTLYITSQIGNFIYKMPVNDLNNVQQISIDASIPSSTSSLNPHEIVFSPDGSSYFVSCQQSNEVRIISSLTDSLLAVIPTGSFPQKMSISQFKPYLFISCSEDTNTSQEQLSSIAIINYQTNTLIKTIYAGYQSSGVVVDDENKRVYITNRNQLSTGPGSHHASICDGKNGYVTAIDLNTLNIIPGFKHEVSVDPYAIDNSN